MRFGTTIAVGWFTEKQKGLQIMRRTASFLVALVLVSILVGGCGCLAADAYQLPQCQKYHTDWPMTYNDD
jgi:hypothetical protein